MEESGSTFCPLCGDDVLIKPSKWMAEVQYEKKKMAKYLWSIINVRREKEEVNAFLKIPGNWAH